METQKSVSDWAESTFGSAGTNFSVLARAHVELAELGLKIATSGSVAEICSEAADVAICLYRLAERNDVNLTGITRSSHIRSIRRGFTSVMRQFSSLMTSLVENDFVVSVGILDSVFDDLRGMVALLSSDSLEEWIDKKMTINRSRKWVVKGGHGQHVEDPSKNGPAQDMRIEALLESERGQVFTDEGRQLVDASKPVYAAVVAANKQAQKEVAISLGLWCSGTNHPTRQRCSETFGCGKLHCPAGDKRAEAFSAELDKQP